MALIDLDYQEILKRECNVTEDTVVDATIPLWWEMYADAGSVNLQYWYTRKHVLLFLQGKTRKLVDITMGPDRQMLSQQFKAVTQMLEQAIDELKRIDPNYDTSAVAELGSIEPISTLPDSVAEHLEREDYTLNATQTGVVFGGR